MLFVETCVYGTFVEKRRGDGGSRTWGRLSIASRAASKCRPLAWFEQPNSGPAPFGKQTLAFWQATVLKATARVGTGQAPAVYYCLLKEGGQEGSRGAGQVRRHIRPHAPLCPPKILEALKISILRGRNPSIHSKFIFTRGTLGGQPIRQPPRKVWRTSQSPMTSDETRPASRTVQHPSPCLSNIAGVDAEQNSRICCTLH